MPFIDPFIVTAWMAAVTTTLKFSTSVLKLPIRNPVLRAGQAGHQHCGGATGNNRFPNWASGLSPWKEDFLATGTDYKSRGARMVEIIEILRGLSTGQYFGYESEHYNFPAIKLCPVPTKPVKILYGSHVEAGLRRAAKLCDGWISAGGHMNEIADMVGRLKDYRKEYGQTGHFDMQIMGPEVYHPDSVKRLADLGVEEVHAAFRDAYAGGPDNRTLDGMIAEMNHYAETVIHKVK